jgi:hypothetical protein
MRGDEPIIDAALAPLPEHEPGSGTSAVRATLASRDPDPVGRHAHSPARATAPEPLDGGIPQTLGPSSDS